ncbi:MAG: bile acid:sodium symporter family protein [Saprospiraceae bacterium]
MSEIDLVHVHFNPQSLKLLNVLLGFLMFGVALDIRISDFRKVLETPKPVLVGILCQYFLFPFLTLMIIYVARPATSVALGMILVSACPSGNMANYLTHRAGANVALSVTLNSITVLFASISTPLVYSIWSKFVPNQQSLGQEINIPFVDMVLIILQVIVLPLLVGMLLTNRFPAIIQKIKKPVSTASLVIFIAFLIGAVIANRDNVMQHLDKIFWIVVIHNALALLMGYTTASLFRLSLSDTRTIAIESGVHNTGLGLLLIFNFFNGLGGMAMIAAFWGIWDLIAPFFLVEYWRRRKLKIES